MKLNPSLNVKNESRCQRHTNESAIKDYDERTSFKERRIAANLNISDYKACDELKDAVMELKKKKRELEAEMKRIATSNRQSK